MWACYPPPLVPCRRQILWEGLFRMPVVAGNTPLRNYLDLDEHHFLQGQTPTESGTEPVHQECVSIKNIEPWILSVLICWAWTLWHSKSLFFSLSVTSGLERYFNQVVERRRNRRKRQQLPPLPNCKMFPLLDSNCWIQTSGFYGFKNKLALQWSRASCRGFTWIVMSPDRLTETPNLQSMLLSSKVIESSSKSEAFAFLLRWHRGSLTWNSCHQGQAAFIHTCLHCCCFLFLQDPRPRPSPELSERHFGVFRYQ